MRKSRQLHLWIGLLTSFIILIESITGLLLLEPGLMGVDRQVQQHMRMEQMAMTTQGEPQEKLQAERQLHPANQGSGIMGFVKNLHKGKIGNADVSFLMEIMAIGLIILTITGMTMSIKILKAQSLRRNRRI